MKNLSITEGKTKNAPKTKGVKTAPPPAPKKKATSKVEKPSKTKLPKGFKKVLPIDNGGRAIICIRQLESGICNTQIEGDGMTLIAMLASSMASNEQLARMVTIALTIK